MAVLYECSCFCHTLTVLDCYTETALKICLPNVYLCFSVRHYNTDAVSSSG